MIGLAVLCAALVADAKPAKFDSFKLVSQRPAIHKNRVLHERTQALHDEVAACGAPLGKAQPKLLMKLHVAADGTVGDIELEKTTALTDDTLACIRKAVGALTYPAQKQPSLLTWVLVYY